MPPTGPPPPRRGGPGGLLVAGAALIAVVLIAVVALVVLSGGEEGTRGCGGRGIKLNVVTSPEKDGLIREAAQNYNGRKVDGQCVEVAVERKSSGEAMAALARGWEARVDGPPPDVWTPASSGWVTLLRHRLSQAEKPPGLVPDDTPGIAVAPLVIAMPRPMAQALGWPGKQIGWDDVLRLSRDPRGWGAYGHPEWGPFKLGKTNPNFSTSGLNATIGAYFAATKKSDDLSAADLNRSAVQSYVRGVESSIVHYGDTTLTFLEGLRRADAAGQGMSYVSAVAVEEMSVWYYNQGNPSGDMTRSVNDPKPRIPLVAIYPKEGTLVSDHPYVRLGTMAATKKRAADDFLGFLRAKDVQQEFGDNAFRSYNNRPGKVITQDNGLLPDQPRKMIAAPRPDVLDRVLRSWESLRKRANVLLVVDVSGSMKEQVPNAGRNRMQLAKLSLRRAVDDFVAVDRVGLWEFSTNLRGKVDHQEIMPIGQMGVPGRKQQMKNRINRLRPRGDTGLYDTTLAAFDHVKDARRPGAINSVVVLTDGKNDDPGGGLSLETLLPKLGHESGVRIFTIAYGGSADGGALKRIAEATDATAYSSTDATSLDKVLAQVTSNF